MLRQVNESLLRFKNLSGNEISNSSMTLIWWDDNRCFDHDMVENGSIALLNRENYCTQQFQSK